MTLLAGHLFAGSRRCPVCGGGECAGFHPAPHPSTYPFLPGGIDPMADKAFVIAPHRIVDHEIGRVMYGTGERVPLADAIRYGLVEPDAPQVEAAVAHLADNHEPKGVKVDVDADTTDQSASADAPAEPRRGCRRGGARARRPSENRAHTPDEDR